MIKKRKYSGAINYLHYHGKRKTLAHYLKAGGFKKIGGTKIYGNYINRRRTAVAIAAAFIAATGLYYVFF